MDQKMIKINQRQAVVKILEQCQADVFVNQAIEAFFGQAQTELTKSARSFIQRVVRGTTEYQIQLDYLINQVAQTKTTKMKPFILIVLRMTVYQLFFMDRVPASAAINEAVKLVKKRKMHSLAGFVNGVLRNINRQKESVKNSIRELETVDYLSIYYSMNRELIVYLLEQYAVAELEAFLEASIAASQTCVRCNTMKTTPDQLGQALADYATVRPGNFLEQAFYLSDYDILSKMKPFTEGDCQVQAESSMLVGVIAAPQPDMTVLDVCSAPGGKVTHIGELMKNTGQLISCDVSRQKTALIDQNINRLGLTQIQTVVQDGTIYCSEFEQKFDLVLLDAPCSGLGVIRNKPDIKLNMTVAKINQLISLQRRLLDNVRHYVKPSGRLIYSTCTINQQENQQQVLDFLANHPDFELIDLAAVDLPMLVRPYVKERMLQLLTDTQLSDGFFIALLQRRQ